MGEDNVVRFSPPAKKPSPEYLLSEEENKREARSNLAAAIAMLQKPYGEEDLEKTLQLINEAWGIVCGIFIMRPDR